MTDFADDDVMRKALREPFPPEQIGKLPASQKRPALDFVGHAAVTDRLNAVAPDATWTVDELFTQGGVCWIRGTMTIGGVSRPEYGDGKDPKEAIGNFIRRGAMRFGVALDLWSREELTANLKDPASPTAINREPSSSVADEQVSSEPSIPADAEGAVQVAGLSAPVAAPISSAAPEATGTSGGEDRGTAESSAAGADASGEGRDPNLPTSRRDQLWKQLVEFAGGSKRKALNAVNTTMKASWTEGHIADIPPDDLEHTLKALLQREGVA